MHTLLVNLETGSATIIGEQGQCIETLQSMIQESLKTDVLDG